MPKNENKINHHDNELVRNIKPGLIADLVSTKTFRRLNDVSFLGAIDPWLNKNKSSKSLNSDRFHHSIGVYSIAQKIMELDENFPDDESKIFPATALLHDLGHGPLSHSLESIFDREFGVNHHNKTEDLILDSSGEIYQTLRDHYVHPTDITLTLDKKVKPYFAKYMNGPFNVDTLDGIYRCYGLLGIEADYSLNSTIKASLLKYEQSKNERILDSFWKMKENMYNRLIYQGYGRIADEVAQNFIEDNLNSISPDMFELTDTEFFLLFTTLQSKITENVELAQNGYYLHHVNKTRERRFEVRPKCRIENEHSILFRYYQTKLDWTDNSTIGKETKTKQIVDIPYGLFS